MLADCEPLRGDADEEVLIGLEALPSSSLGVVERTVFRLVLGGVCDGRDVAGILSVFSPDVIANAITALVNTHQLLSSDVSAHMLRVSEVAEATLEACREFEMAVVMPPSLAASLEGEGLLVTDAWQTAPDDIPPGELRDVVISLKHAILSELLPDVKAVRIARALDFRIYRKERET